jgi:ABC-type Fe3+ transport system permease subunit
MCTLVGCKKEVIIVDENKDRWIMISTAMASTTIILAYLELYIVALAALTMGLFAIEQNQKVVRSFNSILQIIVMIVLSLPGKLISQTKIL